MGITGIQLPSPVNLIINANQELCIIKLRFLNKLKILNKLFFKKKQEKCKGFCLPHCIECYSDDPTGCYECATGFTWIAKNKTCTYTTSLCSSGYYWNTDE